MVTKINPPMILIAFSIGFRTFAIDFDSIFKAVWKKQENKNREVAHAQGLVANRATLAAPK